MFSPIKIRAFFVFTGGLMLLLAYAPVVLCQTEEVELAPPDTLEEVIVYGEKSRWLLKYEVYRAEEKLFETFNALNSDDEYDVHCFYEVPTGSRIRQRVCMPNFVKTIRTDAGQAWLENRGPNTNWGMVQVKEQKLLEEMKTLMNDHPELREARDSLGKAKLIYDSERKRD